MSDQDAEAEAQKRLEQLLLAGLNSGDPIEVTPESWRKRREELVERRGRRLLRAADLLDATERVHAIAGIRAGLEAFRRGEGVVALEALEHIQKEHKFRC